MRRTLLAPLLLTVAVAVVAVGVLLIRQDGDSRPDGIVVRDAWTAPNQLLSAVYLTIDNGGTDDQLVGASSDRAATVSLMSGEAHTGSGDPVDLDVPAGTSELQPGGSHLMLQDVSSDLQPGDRFDLRLDFDRTGPVDVTVEVLSWDEATARSR